MGFFDSTSQATDNRQAATDQGTIFGRNVGTYTAPGAVTVGSKGTLLGAGSTQTVVKGAKGNVTVTNSDPAVAQAAIDKVSGVAAQFGQSLADFMTESNQNALQLAAINSGALQTTTDSILASQNQSEASQQTTFGNTLDKFAALLTNQQPAGDTLKNNIALYVILAAMALVGWIIYRRQ